MLIPRGFNVPKFWNVYKFSPKSDAPFLSTTMAPTKKRRAKPIIQNNIPSDPSATITTREFKRSSTSCLLSITSVSSSRSSTPLPVKTTHKSPADTAETQLYSDVDEELLETAKKSKRKGPSRSVNVSTPYPSPSILFHVYFLFSRSLTILTQPTDVVGGMAPVSRGIYGRIYSAGVISYSDVSPTMC